MTQRRLPRQDDRIAELGTKLVLAEDTLGLIRVVISDPDSYRVPSWTLTKIAQILALNEAETRSGTVATLGSETSPDQD